MNDKDYKSYPFYGSDSLPLKVTLCAFWKILKIYWCDKASLKSWFYLAIIVSLTSGAIYIAKAINEWYKAFWDTIQNYDLEGFKYQLGIFCLLATIHVFVSVYNAYLRSLLAIDWRTFLSEKLMDHWLDEESYYKLQLTDRKTDNPDQRIAEDLNLFVAATMTLLLGTATDLGMMVTFGVVLWDLSQACDVTVWGYQLHLPDGYLFYLAFVYAILGTIVTFILGKPLVRLNFRQQRYEADFRFSLIRVRENAESIALYKGKEQEGAFLKLRFRDLVSNYIKLIKCEKRLGFLTLGYAQLAVIFPLIIAAPLYFAKIITIGSIMQISSAFGRVQDALSTLISNFSSWASWKSVVDRLSLFHFSLIEVSQLQCLKPKVIKEDAFVVSSLSVKDPANRLLCENLSFSIKSGDSLLIQGRSGCGKSTLIRSIASIWPYAKGEICIPEGSLLFLSQRPYLPQGTLREAASYPNKAISDGSIEKYFELLGLSHLIDKLDTVDIWSHILSLGEMQRVAFVRVLVNKPKLIFLDEATSALDEATESKAYTLVKDILKDSIIVSVGHRGTLVNMHKYILKCNDSVTWEFLNNKK